MSSCELLGALWVNKLHIFYNIAVLALGEGPMPPFSTYFGPCPPAPLILAHAPLLHLFWPMPPFSTYFGPCPPSPLILGKKENKSQIEGRKAGRTSNPPPPPLPLARGLDPPLYNVLLVCGWDFHFV